MRLPQNAQIRKPMPVRINHPGAPDLCLAHRILAVEVDVAMQVQGRLVDSDQPAVGLDTLVGAIVGIVDAPGRGMRHQHVQVAPVAQPVAQQAQAESPGQQPQFCLAVLVWATVVFQRPFDARQQQPALCVSLHPPVQVAPTRGSLAVVQADMVAVDVVERHVEHADEVVEVVVVQVAAADRQIGPTEA